MNDLSSLGLITGCDPLKKHQAAEQYLLITSQFEADHYQDYCGTAIIIAQSRKNSDIESHLSLTSELQQKYPEFILGTKHCLKIIKYIFKL